VRGWWQGLPRSKIPGSSDRHDADQPSFSFYRGLCLAAVIVAAPACGLAPAGAAQRSAEGNTTGFVGFLNDVTCVSAADCWAFGQNSSQYAVAGHWNGAAWSMVRLTSPAGALFTYLPSVSCAGPASCWAVGFGFPGPLMERWNGHAWSYVPDRQFGSNPRRDQDNDPAKPGDSGEHQPTSDSRPHHGSS